MPPRADAVRNRERVLAAARDAFATDGPGVSLDDVARRAGVGAGTVHRHFPTKDALFVAVIADRLHRLAAEAGNLAGAEDPGAAFFAFFAELADQARENLALSAALAAATDRAATDRAATDRAATDRAATDALRAAGAPLAEALAVLLTRAQDARAVRADITVGDLHAILAGALLAEQRLDPASRGRGVRVVADGLRVPRADQSTAATSSSTSTGNA
jgi:AcrR family transcriptional regulator